MSIAAQEFVRAVGDLFSLPEVAVRLNAMLDDPDSSMAEIGEVISQDPGLTMRVLHLVNSPFYGLSAEVDTISKAVTILGTRQIRNLVLATSVISVFKGLPVEHITMEGFWRHSLYCAVIARLLSERCLKGQAETLFTAGLLHDIGQLVIFSRIPEKAHEAYLLSLQGRGEMAPEEAERRVMGFDHAQVGGALARAWNLPLNLQECVEFHHDPGGAEDHPVEVAVVHIANSLAHLADIDSRDPRDAPPMEPESWGVAGLSRDVMSTVVDTAQRQILDAETLLSTHPT